MINLLKEKENGNNSSKVRGYNDSFINLVTFNSESKINYKNTSFKNIFRWYKKDKNYKDLINFNVNKSNKELLSDLQKNVNTKRNLTNYVKNYYKYKIFRTRFHE